MWLKLNIYFDKIWGNKLPLILDYLNSLARLSFLSPFVELTNEENVEADRNILGRLERRGEVKIFHDLDLLAIVCDGGCHIDQYYD